MSNTRLRSGFTTGTYAAATALAAWRCMHGRRNGNRVATQFPDKTTRRVNIDGWERTATGAHAWAIKDAGDDIDITNKAILHTNMSYIEAGDVLNSDYVEQCGRSQLVIRAGSGVGKSTRPGLDVPAGKWAINPVPRKMIVENIKATGQGKKKDLMLVEVSIEDGVKLAKKTLNPILGIENGLSILGTSGLVIPCSNKAYIDTIRVLIKGASEYGCSKVVLVTGGRTHRLAKKQFPNIPEIAFIRIGDFIKESLTATEKYGFKEIVIVCMPGKLAKYAQGHAYTHAHTVSQSMESLADLLGNNNCPEKITDKCLSCRSVREYLESLETNAQNKVIKILKHEAIKHLQSWAKDTKIKLFVLEHKQK